MHALPLLALLMRGLTHLCLAFHLAPQVQRELGLQFRPISETLIDAAVSMILLGMAHPKIKEVEPDVEN